MSKLVEGIRGFLPFQSRPDLLTEEDQRMIDQGEFILAGVLQRADARNGNGRIYPYSVLKREVENYKKLVKEKRALGELDHPESSVVNLKNASHLVTEIWWEGKDVMGKVKILNTSSGKELKELINEGVVLGISSRGLGSTQQRGSDIIVEDDFQLICFDFVSEPSTEGAFMLREGVERGSNLFDKSYRINRALNDIISSRRK